MKKRFLAALTAILLLSASCSNVSGAAADPSEALTSPTGQTPSADLPAEKHGKTSLRLKNACRLSGSLRISPASA